MSYLDAPAAEWKLVVLTPKWQCQCTIHSAREVEVLSSTHSVLQTVYFGRATTSTIICTDTTLAALHFPQFNRSNLLESEIIHAQINSFTNFKVFLGWMSDHHTSFPNKQDNTNAYRTYRATLHSKRRIRKCICSLHICVLQARLYLEIMMYLFLSLHVSTKRDSNVT